MALFGIGKKKKEKKEKAAKPKESDALEKKEELENKGVSKEAVKKTNAPERQRKSQTEKIGGDTSSVLIRPRITEKATIQSEGNAYVFEVSSRASKSDIKNAVIRLYKVHPRKINVVNKKAREVFSRMRGRRGRKPGLRKAYVYLNEGDRIEII